MKTRAAKILEQHTKDIRNLTKIERELFALKVLVSHLINNDIPHIWMVVKITLGAVVSAIVGAIIKMLFF